VTEQNSTTSQPDPPPAHGAPRTTTLVAMVLLATAAMWIKIFVLGHVPSDADAGPIAPRMPAPTVQEAPASRPSLMTVWNPPEILPIRRNLFAIPLAAFPADDSKPPVQVSAVGQGLQDQSAKAAAPATPTVHEETPAPARPQVIVVMAPPSGAASATVATRADRHELAQSAYQDALDEINGANPDVNEILWNLDSAVTLDPGLTDAADLRAKIATQQAADGANGGIGQFVGSQILGATTRPTGGP
jgi:hypothetical protein